MTLRTGGDLYYDFDGPSGSNPPTSITSATVIPDFDPVNVFVNPTEAVGSTTVTFGYVVTDAAGVVSDPKTINVPFGVSHPLTSFEAKKVRGTRYVWIGQQQKKCTVISSGLSTAQVVRAGKRWRG